MNLAELFVRVSADVSGLKRGVADANSSMRGMEKSAGRLGAAFNKLGGIFAAAFSVRALTAGLARVNEAADALDASNRRLAATAKITGQNLGFLQVSAQKANDQFRIGARLSNDFAIEMTKLASKAGQVDKVTEGIEAFLNLGAGQGMGAAETLRAVQQAILGIDEGTDKLFQKNPSVLYAELAAQIGKSAASLTDGEKALAIFSAGMRDGGKVAGEYAEFLKSPAGQAEQLRIRVEEAAESIGKSMAGIRTVSYPVLSRMAEMTIDLIAKFRTLAVEIEEAWFRLRHTDFENAISRGGRQTERTEESFRAYVDGLEAINQKRLQILADTNAALNFDPSQNAVQTILDNTTTSATAAAEAVNEYAKALERLDARVGFRPRDRSLGDPSVVGGVDRRTLGGVGLTPVTARGSQVPGVTPERERGFLDEMFSGLKKQIADIASNFGPLAIAAAALQPVFQGLRDTLGPVLYTLAEPLRMIGQLLGSVIAPVLKLLAPPLNLLAKGVSYVVEAFGWLIEALGNFVDSLIPDWISKAGKGLANMGQELQDGAKAARRNLGAVNDVTDGMEKLASSMSNVPSVFANALRRFQASTVGIGGGSVPGAPVPKPWDRTLPYDGPGGATGEPFFSINNVTVIANDPAEFARQMESYGQKVLMRGGYSNFALQGG